ncbi:FecR family protein [Chitinophaga agrisoli]|nr:FecR domain-containing protein [Chitinophaga agrisoli]
MTQERLKYLLDRYLDQTATEEELQEYAAWYQQQSHTEEPLFKQEGGEDARAYSRQLYAGISAKIRMLEPQTRKRPVLHYMKWAAAAAAVAVGVIVLYNSTRTKDLTAIAQRETQYDRQVVVTNNTDKARRIQLQDGSIAELSPGSEVSYNDPFGSHDRELHLKGKGFFEVAQHAPKPFTVYGHNIVTTALGTAFTVTAWPQEHNVWVALHSGKVVVKNSRMKDVYLLPGQQLSCNLATGKATLQSIATNGATAQAAAVPTLGGRTGFTASFDQAPMTAVLDSLQAGYDVPLKYNRNDMEDLLFSGSIRETDSLSQVLKRIALLYDLKIKPTDRQFIIRKNH